MEDNREWKYCVIGNIVRTRIDENGILRYGTSAFTGGTKVYICGKYWDERAKTITVIGLNRFKKFSVSDIPPNAIENVRCQRVYKPKVIEIMDDFEFWDYWWGNTKKEKKSAELFVDEWEVYVSVDDKMSVVIAFEKVKNRAERGVLSA